MIYSYSLLKTASPDSRQFLTTLLEIFSCRITPRVTRELHSRMASYREILTTILAWRHFGGKPTLE